MKKVISFVIIITLTMGCNQNNEKYPQEIDIAFFKENDIVFRDTNFIKLIDDIITSQPIIPSNGYNSILIYLSLDKKDTIMT
ncbi:MAG: hypothetical protein Q4G18_11795, partial [Myroides sp.]|nr:hypothetical protein [Myroides sp.]